MNKARYAGKIQSLMQNAALPRITKALRPWGNHRHAEDRKDGSIKNMWLKVPFWEGDTAHQCPAAGPLSIKPQFYHDRSGTRCCLEPARWLLAFTFKSGHVSTDAHPLDGRLKIVKHPGLVLGTGWRKGDVQGCQGHCPAGRTCLLGPTNPWHPLFVSRMQGREGHFIICL